MCFQHTEPPSSSSFWKFAAIILWIVCLGLLVFFGIFTIKLNQKLFQVEVYPGNLSSNEEANKTVNQKSFQEEGNEDHLSSNKETIKIVWKCPSCSYHWHQFGENCYYFSRDIVPWKECHLYCDHLSSRFVILNNEEEMKFIKQLSKMQCGMLQENFWISLSYNSSLQKWMWIDGTDLTLDKLPLPEHEDANGKCMHIKFGQISYDDCENGYCICKKTIYSD